jgi:hypothetical protein
VVKFWTLGWLAANRVWPGAAGISSVDGDRKTSAVCHCHELRTLAPLGLSHFCAPFLATTNMPETVHCDKSRSPRTRRSSAKVASTRLSRPSLTHSWNLRWQVWYGRNLSGRSHHLAPVHPLAGKEQSRSYAISENCRFVIPSNGNLHYFWDLEGGNPSVISKFPKKESIKPSS